jgi:GAF domain-containing protein
MAAHFGKMALGTDPSKQPHAHVHFRAEPHPRENRGGAALEVLERLVWLVELQATRCCARSCSSMMDCTFRRRGSKPSRFYVRAIDGIAIGPKAGSCGTAAYQATTIIETNIERDPLWDDYRELAAEYGFRACWSSPILSHTGQVLGTFAMYYRTPRGPLPEEQRLSEIAIHIASIAIENRRAEESLRKSEERYRALVTASSQDVWRTDERGEAFFARQPGAR